MDVKVYFQGGYTVASNFSEADDVELHWEGLISDMATAQQVAREILQQGRSTLAEQLQDAFHKELLAAVEPFEGVDPMAGWECSALWDGRKPWERRR